MKHKHNCIYRLLAVCLLAALCMCSTALAIDQIIPQPASLTVAFAPDGQNGDGVTMRLYRVADMTGFGDFAPIGAFEDIPWEVNGLKDEEWDALAYQLKTYADQQTPAAAPLDVQTVTGGAARFENLDCGLYLLTTDIYTRGTKLYINKPALVSLPNHSDPDDPDAWVYDVTIFPKPGEAESDTLRVRKLWKNTTVGEVLPSVKIGLMINGKLQETVTLSRQNGWNSLFKTKLRSGDNWSIVELDKPNGFDYKWSWECDGKAIWINVTNTKTNPPPKPPEELPKTGQLWWPVPVLAACGMLLFGMGWMRRRRS